MLIDFWINSHKHRKILYRDLDLLCLRRIQMERDLLLRLWYLHNSGRDYGTVRQTVHSATEVVRLVGQSLGTRALHILGAPTRNHEELIAVIEMHRELVATRGRQLAQQFAFEYPSRLEATVLQCWQDYVHDRC